MRDFLSFLLLLPFLLLLFLLLSSSSASQSVMVCHIFFLRGLHAFLPSLIFCQFSSFSHAAAAAFSFREERWIEGYSGRE